MALRPGCGSAAGAVGALVPTLFTLSLPGHWASSCHSLQGNQASLSWQRDAVSPVRVDALHAATGPRPGGLCRRLKLNEVHLADERAEAQGEKGVCLSHSEPRVAFCSSLPCQESGRPTNFGFDLEEMEKLGPQRQISLAKTRAGCVTSGTLPNLSEPQVLVRMHEMTTSQGLAWTKQVLSYD